MVNLALFLELHRLTYISGVQMAKYKPYSYDQGQLIPVMFSKQILPGTLEFALNQLVDEKLDLSIFDSRFRNDEIGAPAYTRGYFLKLFCLHTREA